jgi:hypothetical protein
VRGAQRAGAEALGEVGRRAHGGGIEPSPAGWRSPHRRDPAAAAGAGPRDRGTRPRAGSPAPPPPGDNPAVPRFLCGSGPPSSRGGGRGT